MAMPLSKYAISGLVARLVSDEDLIINKGSADGVMENMIFEILDPHTQDVTDPASGENLGSMDRVLATVRVTQVRPRLSMAHLLSNRGLWLSDAARVMSGYRGPARLTSDTWPEGVREGYPVGFTGQLWSPPKASSKQQ
jgi:hypothetical protein